MSDPNHRALELPEPLRDGSTVLQRDAELYEAASRKNIERYVGCARVPVGLAGPVRIHGEHVDGEVVVPLATTEGTLVASTHRGMKVLNECGGVIARVTRKGGIQRAPVLFFATVDAALACARALESDWRWLMPIAAQSTRHGVLTGLTAVVQGRAVHLRLSMDAGDAAGQNMVSVAASHVVAALAEKFGGLERALMEGGFSGEKVPSALNHLLGRGRAVVASADISASVLERITRAKASEVVHFFQTYVNAGSWGGFHNTHAALINILPAIYIATGQDVASVPESCLAQNAFDWREREGVLRWDVLIPNLVAGTVGGGTGLPTQHECLALMGCAGAGKLDRFAEIVAATALASELSFWSAILAGEWVAAHAGLKDR